jgi:predicted MFS family arabinose efflux permease
LPIFFERQLSFPPSLIYFVYMLSSGGAILGYLVAGRRSPHSNVKTQMRRIVLFRSLLIFSLVAVVDLVASPTVFAGIILIALGFAYAVYYVLTLVLSMELVPQGKNAIFDVLVGLGAATGSFLGPYLAGVFDFIPTFLLAGSLFFLAFLIVWLFT